MAFQISPGINITEIDRTGVISQIVSNTTAAYVGNFKWGAVNEITTVTSENDLVAKFGGPDDTNYEDFFSAANYIGYGAPLQLIRASNSTAKVATFNGDGFDASKIWNQEKWEALTDYGISAASGVTGVLCAKYPGIFGNSLKISMSDNPARGITFTALSPTWTGQVADLPVGATLAGTIAAGDYLKFGDRRYQYLVTETDADSVKITVSGATGNANAAISGASSCSVVWAYERYLPYTPSTSLKAASLGYSKDEVAFAVVDEDGLFTGNPGSVLETYIGSKAANATLKDGANFYYPGVLSSSEFTRWISHPSSADLASGDGALKTWGSTFNGLGATVDPVSLGGGASGAYKSLVKNVYRSLNGGTDPNPTEADVITGYQVFEDSENTESNLFIQGRHKVAIAQYLIDLCETRKDAITFVGAPLATVKDKSGAEATEDLIYWKDFDLKRNSSYAIMDTGWKYQYDKYSDTYRWVPLNPDIAGLSARTDAAASPWFSPAGYNRGQIRNVVKLAFNPSKPLRDALYTANINPVISTAGSGTILFGDKTLLNKPSAFDRINVRRLFIALEKAVSTAAKFQLFEFNDEFTRANFIGLVEPFLRDVQASNGISEFKIICDETNNTPQVIDNNEFVADIYIKPLKTINYVQLNFIATRSDANFSEIGAAVNI